MNEHPLWSHVSRHAPAARALADAVWATPETCYQEARSAAAHAEAMEALGFAVTREAAGIPTAVVGEAGAGGPVIAFLAEYDALAGLSQEADVAEPRPLETGANGHGCGHNLLGAGALLAAAALKDWLTETGRQGTVRIMGCPAEEGGAGKTFMAREGLFDDVDVAITWHPHAIPAVMRGSSLANCRVDFTFRGRAAHAAAAPHLGRSALDAMELMSVGVNYLREHMPPSARLHYAILEGGGISPNVVQAVARVRYVVRDETAPKMLALLERVRKVARGAAMMTETEVEDRVLAAVSNLLPNGPLIEAMQRNLEALGPPAFDDLDRAYAARFQATFTEDDIESNFTGLGLPVRPGALADFVAPAEGPALPLSGSTDVADVSWVVPTVQMWGATQAIGTPFHSWQMVAQGTGGPAIKGMVHAAAVMAATGADCVTDPELVARAKADLAARAPQGWTCPLPEGSAPPVKEMA